MWLVLFYQHNAAEVLGEYLGSGEAAHAPADHDCGLFHVGHVK
jgi:hypothetical protein